MRVYELSKQLGIPNKELLDVLAKNGYEISTHMAMLTPEALAFLQKKFSKPAQPVTVPQEAPQKIEKAGPEKQQEKTTKPSTEQYMEKIHTPTSQSKPAFTPPHASYGRPTMPGAVDVTMRTATVQPVEPFVLQPMTVGELATKVNKPVNELIIALLKQGMVSAKNQLLPIKAVEKVAQLYSAQTIAPSAATVASGKVQQVAEGVHKRSPVIVVIGHVDHGKTTLLDYIRKTRVAAKEQGGITQHLGAYQVKTSHGGLVFLDTPGHAAFTKIRARGVRVADLAILVVAADDGIMPQTIEAIKHAKAVNVPIIVALNKIDKATPAQIENVKRGLSQHDLLPEEWGGSVVCVPVSAKTGQGIDQLLEMIALQAELMELRTDDNAPVEGFILEARMEKGRGPVATVLSQQGTLKIGDYFVAGKSYGRVNSIMDSNGKSIKAVGPSIPVQVAGFTILPEAGDQFKVATQEKYSTARSTKDTDKVEARSFATEDSVNLIIKTDTKSSKEAILSSLNQISAKSPRKIHIVNSAVGDISEGDVTLAATTGSSIIGFHTKAESNALALAQREKVKIELYQVIYKLLDDLEMQLKENEAVKTVSTRIGQAIVRKVFEIKNLGTIAGCYLKEGRFARNGTIVGWRGNQKIGAGAIKSLERDRKTVKEVHAGFEFAFLADGVNDWQIDDRVECFVDLPAEK